MTEQEHGIDDDHVAIDRRPISLDDKWTVGRGRVLLNGTQALARVLLAQHDLDRSAGLNTAGYITGYRGSPLGNIDMTLWGLGQRLADANITFAPGVNEDLAATAVHGTQQLDAVPEPLYDGVFAAWYGKGPGVDRSGDAFKHGNFAGTHRHGGVAVFYGDDHGGKSSTVAHHSEQALAASLIPSLYPSDVGEILEYGLTAFAMSRYSGAWVGVKLVNEVVEQTGSADIDLEHFRPTLPPYAEMPPEGVHFQVGYAPLRDEQIASEHRLPMVQAFVRANGIDRTIFRAGQPRVGLVSAGKSYGDTRRALDLLGLDERAAAALGLSLYKVGCIWPLEPEGIARFAAGHDTVFVIEEKKSFLELQAAATLINLAERPRLIGKRDEQGDPLLPLAAQLDPATIALAIVERLARLGVTDAALSERAARLARSRTLATAPEGLAGLPRRTPYFCSGCPHNRSTKVPEGSLSITGIGCHTMVMMARPAEALPPAQMGAEGTNWVGLAPFTGTRHIFQNMGDGTYYHSGLLAIRAAVASGVNITYKILYNDAVAMTGGQPIDGPISVAEIAQQVRHEGVKTIWVVSDNPGVHRDNPAFPPGVAIGHRDDFDSLQRDLRDVPGCSVIIYEQTCAAEKRRRRKRGTYPDPAKRLFIATAVCEGCGDCSVQSTCVSLMPVETAFGTKRSIDQSSCNKDYSCLNGFCPSFITVEGAEPRKPQGAKIDDALFADLTEPTRAALSDGSFNIMVTGVGGTGVITVAAILGMAAHIEGLATSLFDMTGLAQKNGAVYSHIRIADSIDRLHAQKLGSGEADALIAFDLVAALSDEASSTFAPGRTQALVNGNVLPTVAFQFDRDTSISSQLLLTRLQRRIGADAVVAIDAAALAVALLGDSIAANMFLVGAAAQLGLLPVGFAAIEEAIVLNATAVAFNRTAFRLGRLFVADRAKVEALLPAPPPAPPSTLEGIVAAHVDHLTAYQNQAYAARFSRRVASVRAREREVDAGGDALAFAVARTYGRLLAYKDEYEVARLLTGDALKADLARTFADGGTISFNLAPPILGGKPINGRPRKHAFPARWMTPMLRLLARAKGLRGSMFDPFGRSAERRTERALIAEYEVVMDEVMLDLSSANHASAVALLSLPLTIRGYGPVKHAAIDAYRAALPAALDTFRKAAPSAARAA